MVYCAFAGCKSNNNKKSRSHSIELRYFSFPFSCPELCKLWIEKCKNENINIKNAKVCSKHFQDNDFHIKERLLGLNKNKWKLKSGVVPGDFPNIKKELPEENIIIEPNVSDLFVINDEKTQNIEELWVNGIKEELSDNDVKEEIQEEELLDNDVKEELQDNDEYIIEPNDRDLVAIDEETKKEELLNLRKIIIEQEKINIRQQNEIVHLNKIIQTKLEQLNSVEKVFTTGQLRKLKTGKRICWKVKDMTSAISLYAKEPESYRLLQKKGCLLPPVCTLRRWARKVF